jgi:hypothetical protein
MKKYNVRITEYYRIDGIEAESLEEAERIALMMDWVKTDHFRDVTLDAEEVEA